MGGQVSILEPGRSSQLLRGAWRGDVEAVKAAVDTSPGLVLHKGVGIGSTHDSAWHVAAAYGHVEVLKALMQATRANIALIKAKLSQRLKKQLTNEQALSLVVNQLNSKNQSPLHFACYSGQAECAAALIQMGADPWIQDNCAGRTALHYAAMHGYVDTVKAVMSELSPTQAEHYSEGRIIRLVDLRTVSGLAPLHYACYAAKPGIVEVLLECGANPVCHTTLEGVHDLVSCPRFSTPLHIAAQQGHTESIEAILKHYMSRRHTATVRDPRLCADRVRRLPLHVAKLRGHRHLIRYLHPLVNLEEVFDVEQIASKGVPKLSVLASRALRRYLLAQADAADAMISTLPPLGLHHGAADVVEGAAAALSRTGSAGRLSRCPSTKSVRNHRSGGNAAELQGSQQPSLLRRTLSGLRVKRAASGELSGETAGDRSGLGADQDWWAPDPARPPSPDLGQHHNNHNHNSHNHHQHAATADDVLGSHPGPGPHTSPFESAAHFWGAPTPQSAFRGDTSNKVTLLQRLRSLGRGRNSLGSEPGAGSTPAGASPRSGALPALSAAAGVTLHVPETVSNVAEGHEDEQLGAEVQMLNTLSRGTRAVVSALPSHAECVVCLEEVYPLVVVPCLHRVCATCTRRMAMALESKPLGCPVCRTNVQGVYAPHDVCGLGSALQSRDVSVRDPHAA